MMAWDDAGCERMRKAARKSGKILEIGYQRNYNPIYQAAHERIVKSGQLGDVYHARTVWHRNGTWRRKGDPPSPDDDPSPWGYPDYDHVYSIFEYTHGRTAVFTSIESNAYEHYYEAFYGTRATLILRGETEAYLFDEGGGARPTTVDVSPKAAEAVEKKTTRLSV